MISFTPGCWVIHCDDIYSGVGVQPIELRQMTPTMRSALRRTVAGSDSTQPTGRPTMT
jgi:hypothetical protein